MNSKQRRVFGVIALTALAWLLPGFCSAEVVPVAQVSCGGSSTDPALAYSAVRSFRTLADEIAPVLQRNGWKRILLKNPGGWHYKPLVDGSAAYPNGYRKMWIDQWALAKASRQSFAVDADLIYFHDRLVGSGIEEIIVYLGVPETLGDPLVEGRKHVGVFKNMGVKSSIMFDAVSDTARLWGTADDYKLVRTLALLDELRCGRKLVSIESRPAIGHNFFAGRVAGTMALANTDTGTQKNRLDEAHHYGEIFRCTQDNANDGASVTWTEKYHGVPVTPVVRKWQIKTAASVLPPVAAPEPVPVPAPVPAPAPAPAPVPAPAPAAVTIRATDVQPFMVFTTDVAAANPNLAALTPSAAAANQDWSGISWCNEIPPTSYNSCNSHGVLISDKWVLGGHCATTLAAGNKLHFRDKNGVDRSGTITSRHMLTSRGIWLIRLDEPVHADVTRYPIVTSSSRLLGTKAWGLETPGRIEAVTITSTGQSITHDGSMSSGSSGFPGLVPLSDSRLGILWPHYTAAGGPSAEYYLSEINAYLALTGEAAKTYAVL